MVFESIVADLLNKYLGEYVENLDRSQLQIGIWGGDIVLQNLVLKQSALDELDLPVRTVYGVLEKLVLKIPWKNLYRDPVEAAVERLYLLAVPNQEVKYDPVKEERWAQDAKQNQLNKVEAAKKWEAEKDLLKQDDSFVEKLSTQIVKNIQLKIGEIHIRYEDRVSSLGRPFALGITLHNLSVQTTDANWTKAIKDEASKFIFKELNLEGLAVYWNCDTTLFSDKPVSEMLQLFKDGIAAKERKPKGYEYMLGPINSSAKLQINQKPEQDGSNYSIPKLQLSLELEKLAICISKSQYRDVMLLLESMDWMTRAAPYRKFRPFVPSYSGHSKEWWHFAYKCILEDEVKRKQRNWSWNVMREHRGLCKSYAAAYKQKLTLKKIPAELTIQLQEMENKLDVFNIVLIRQRIEVEVERDQAEELRQKQQRKGWFSSWWGGAAEADAVQPGSAAELAKKIEAVMTPEEKAKLYRAIDYQENTTPAIYPAYFIENVFSFKLRSLEIEVRDGEDKVRTILSSSLQEVTARVEQRMSGQALKAAIKITKFDVTGLPQGTITPELVSSKLLEESDSVLLDVVFETKPLDESCDQRLRVAARPLRVVYDAATVNSIMDLFKPPETPALQNKIQAAIPVAMPALKEMSVLGLQYAVEQQTVLDVVVDVMPSQILIPQNGVYRGNENLLVVNLGRMTVTTASRDNLAMDVRKMHLHGRTEDDILQEMISRSYTKFTFKLEDVQVLLAYAGEDWKAVIDEHKRSAMHVVMPITLTVNLHKCMVTDDPRLPKMKLCAELGQIDIQLPEDRLLNLINLPNSIPFNDSEPSPLGAADNASHSSQLSLFRTMDAETARAKGIQLPKLDKPVDLQPLMQVIELEAKFVLEMLKVTVYEQKKGINNIGKSNDDLDNFDPLITFRLLSLETECVQRTFDTKLFFSIGGIDLKQRYDGADINAICTPMTSGQDQYLFTVRFTQVDKKSPELRTTHQSVLKLLQANFTKLDVLVHQEATLQLIAFANSVQSSLDSSVTAQGSRIANAGGRKEKNLPTILEEEGSTAPAKAKPVAKRKKKRSISTTVDLKIVAEMQSVCIQIETKARPLTSMMVQGLLFGAVMRKAQTEITTSIKDFVMLDLNPVTLHKKILSIVDEEALSAHIVLYDNNGIDDPDATDMAVKVQMACLHVVFLNWFVTSLMAFLNNFQAAQAAVYEASAAAAAVAKQNAKEAYTKATRIFDALLMDFGRLTIKNSFQSLDVQKQYPAVLDKIQLGLVNVKMSRVRLDKETKTVLNERILLQPISFTLSVIRNLSSSWYNESPDLDLSGKINSISLSLTQADYRMLMQALSENMSEGSSELPEPVTPEPAESRMTLATAKTSFSHLPGTQLLQSKEHSTELTPKKVHVFMVFRFTMDSLVINLLSGGSETLEKNVATKPEQGLACFTLYVLALKGQMLSDNSLSTSVRLVDCLLDDTRVGREGKLTRLMESKAHLPTDVSQGMLSPTTEAATRTMLDVTVRMKPNDMFVDVRIFSFNLIVSIDYLLKISNFFVGVEAKPKPVAPAVSKTTTQSMPSSMQSRSTLAVAAVESAKEIEKRAQTVMTINLKLEKPDILLVEAMDDVDTNALVLNCELSFNLRQEGEEMKIKGALDELQLFTCCFNNRIDTKSPVLQPVRINLAGSTKPGQGLHMEVISSDIRIAVTPATLELLNHCQATLTAKHGPDEDEIKAEADYSNIWESKGFNESDFWFLKTEMAQDAMTTLAEASQPEEIAPVTPLSELVIVTMPSIVVTVEAGVGSKTMPMILLETSFQGYITDFSSLLHIDSSLNLQMYYNSGLALWEPLIEPVESHKGNQVIHVPWELKMEVEFNDVNATTTSFEDSTLSNETETETAQLQPLMNVSISSKENLEITVTKTSLDVISTLGEGFKTAMKDGLPKIGLPSAAPYQVWNYTGLPVELNLASSSFKLANQMESRGIATVVLESGGKAELELKEGDAHGRDALALKSSSGGTVQERILRVGVTEKKAVLELPVIRADKRYFSLQQKGDTNPLQWGLVSEVQVEDGGFIVSLRSIIQVHNHFNVGINVYYMTPRGNEVESVGVVEPGQKINLPLKAVYTPTSELFFSVEGHSVSVQPFVWRELQKTLGMTNLLQCDPKHKEEMEPFFIKAVGEMEQIFYENTSRHTMASTCYNVHLRPAVILKNFLPIDLLCQLQGAPDEKPLKAGERMQIPTAEPGNFTIIPKYLEKEWSCKNQIRATPSEFAVWVFESFDSNEKVCLDLGVHTVSKNGSLTMAIYAPFWMLNKTGRMLSYRPAEETGNVVYHPANFKGPILLSYRAKDLHSKKKAALKIEDGEWSTNFPLDVAGSSGLISCKVEGVVYQIGVHIQLNSNSLTKQVTFTPYYVLVNNAPFAIECRESDRPNDSWIRVEPGACNPFWPVSSSNEAGLRVRVAGTIEMSGSFSYNSVYTVLLRLNNKYGGLNVDVQMTEGGVYVSFTPYEPGLAPALVINHTSEIIQIWESGSGYMKKLGAKEMVLFAWEKPSGDRSLCWSCNKSKELSDNLRKDGIGEFHPHQGVKVYWVSFLDGIQRVLLFTSDPAVARDAQSAGELEVPTMAVSISIYGLGLSLVNSLRQQELVYIGIASSGVIWETRKFNGSRFKQFTVSEGLLIEEAWVRYNKELQIGSSPNPRMKVGKYEVDFEKEEILSPNKRVLRRSFQTGLWIQRKVSAHQEQLHVKVNRLQIDNQMADCIFPVVLAPVPPPKSVAANSVLKPFIEMSIVKRLTEHSPVQQYKYYKALVQEFHVKVDIGFLNAILAFFEAEEVSDADEAKTFSNDMKAVNEPLMSHVALQSSAEQKNFYDLLHFSPLKIHVSFSLGEGASSQNLPRVLSVLLESLGVTLTDMNDVVFKLAYLERQYVFLTQAQLQSEATMHYTGQLLKQLYVLVLGLDVIGNPFGLVVGLTKGVEDLFYEPFQGAIQGPGEFAEGLMLGVRSLFGHTVGGAAGAASRITGTIGKGLAALTFDKDYIRKRRENLNKRPANLQTGLAQSGKGLVMGVFDGVTGVFTKPISGAKEEGVEGFFKGVGKGVAGLLTRPTAGIVDFASGSLSAVKRATEMTDEVVRLRPPRYFQPDGLVRPYIRHEAEGNKILRELEKGRYNTTDAYIYHRAMTHSGKEILLLTDKRVAYLRTNDIFGGWQVDWTYTWASMTEAPKEVNNAIHISTGEHKKKAFGLFGGSDGGKLILVPDANQRQWLLTKMQDLKRRSA
ncbi:Vacuolar protein sorting-associated protein 13 [Frankliniella fusca]|uniref:Vacuolar protein sorting-associated protein 13 n=1 Tax=Frankliniella fusca TaxID=407009 RepID=A0AAE1H2I2_9NEOP|nr:Vacuolar protein sorting-associated protein 13 [Frankliniella fusca]